MLPEDEGPLFRSIDNALTRAANLEAAGGRYTVVPVAHPAGPTLYAVRPAAEVAEPCS